MAKTKAELLAEAKELGVTGVDDNTTNADIEKAIEAHKAANPPSGSDETATGSAGADDDQAHEEIPADLATDAQHPASIVEDLPTDQKAGPSSIQSREIRPDEQNLPPGTSALQAPPEA